MPRAGRLDDTLSALADPQRRRIVELLGQGPRRAGELAQVLKLSPPAMSRHLRQLRQAGLVAQSHPEFDARVRIFTLNPKPLGELHAWLAETERLWTDQLDAFKAHVERKP